MNIYQMLKHNTFCEEMYLGKMKYKRAVLGYIFGKSALKSILKDDKPLKKTKQRHLRLRIWSLPVMYFLKKKNGWL